MHGSVLRICRLLVVVLLVAGVAAPALAGPKEYSTPTHGESPWPPDKDMVFDVPSWPTPVPEGEPDDYMDICDSQAPHQLWWCTKMVVRLAVWLAPR